MKRLLTILLLALCIVPAIEARHMSDLKIYINPGHGGYTSNDRPIRIHPFEQNDTNGYWESKSNLYKGLHMYHILDSLGATPYLSRTKNTEADDRSLSGICTEANNLGVDMLISIHSNAGENVNYPLMLYRENTIGTPRFPEAVELSKITWHNLHSNQLSVWTHNTERVCGDLDFYQNMWEGGLGVLRTLYVVGFLSEGSMHEHRPEAHRLMNDDIWWLEAWHFVKSIMEFYNTEDRFVTGNVAGIVYDDHRLREAVMPANFSKFGRDTFAPLNGASVELVDASGNVVQRRTTDQMYNGAFVFRNVAPGNYTLRSWRDDYHMSEKAVEVKACEVTYNDMPLTLKRMFPLAVTKYSPDVEAGQTVSCSSTIDFEFNTDIDVESFEQAFSISPAVEGYFEYSESYTKAKFIPSLSLEGDVTYTVTLGDGARHTDSNYEHPNMMEPLVFSFKTLNRNRMELIDQFPRQDGKVHYTAPTFEFRFDNSVDPSNAFDVITITDSQGKNVALNKRSSKFNSLSNGYGNIIYAVQGNLTEGENYTLKISTDLRDRENLPMSAPLELNFTAVDVTSGIEAGTVVEDFEENGATFFDYDAEHSTGIGNVLPKAIRSTADKVFGKASCKFTYKFVDNHGGDITWVYTGEPKTFNVDDRIAMYLNGDFNGHTIYAILTSGTDVKYVELGNLDFRGWQRREAVLDMLDPSYPYLLGGIRMVQNTSPITQQGGFNIDDITRLAPAAGVEDIIADAPTNVEAWPLPATDVVNLRSASAISNVEIFDMAGKKVASATTDRISVAHLAPGMYVIRVVTAAGTSTIRMPKR